MTAPGYFDDLYADNPDPWALSSSDYEQRKLALLLAALPREHYGSAFEPGCAIGITTSALAARCDRLLAIDGAAAAVAQAQARVTDPHVTVGSGRIPEQWPGGSLDLIVLSELLYYLARPDRLTVARLVRESLAPGGDVIAVHWRHRFNEAATSGDVVHAELANQWRNTRMLLVVDHIEEDFRLQVYRRPEPRSPRP